MTLCLRTPYALLVGATANRLDAKTAAGIAHWRAERCAGQIRLPGGIDLGLADFDVDGAHKAGVGTVVVGLAPPGGRLPAELITVCADALRRGMDVASGLHMRLSDDATLARAAQDGGATIYDVRTPPAELKVATGAPRSGRRLLTVGSDCAVGKMFTTLAIHAALVERGVSATFRATGQTGILIEGSGIAVDAVVADFISGAVEGLCPPAPADHWDVIEGQGSLFQPAYSGVSLGLLHGAQPDALVVCAEAGRTTMEDVPGYPVPDLASTISLNLQMARLVNPGVALAGVSLNTARYGEDAARALLERLGRAHDVPVVDPVRTGVAAIAERLAAW